jgi:hypothetical protein
MRTTNKIITMCLIVAGLAFAGCSDKKDDPAPTPTPTPEPTKTEYLVAKNWKITAYTSNPAIDWDGSGTMVTDVYAQMQACEKDNLYIFNANGTSTDDEGATKCSASDPQTSSAGPWAFNTTQTVITWDGTDYIIEALGANTLRVREEYNPGTGVNYTFTITLTKQ